MEKAGIQRVVWKRPVIDRSAPVCRSTAVEEIPFLAISRALGMLYSIQGKKHLITVALCCSWFIADEGKQTSAQWSKTQVKWLGFSGRLWRFNVSTFCLFL